MTNPLPSWHETSTKQTILNFVTTVTDQTSPNYVPPADRVATFDNDGTLWCEKPAYIQLFFVIQRLQALAQADPTLLGDPAYKAAVSGDMAYFAGLYPGDMPALMKLIFDTHAGMPQQEFERLAADFLNNTHHPRFKQPYKALTYRPMVELIEYLQANDFKVFIASAGGMSFMRTVSEEIYNVPRENVIGSNITFEVVRGAKGELLLLRKPGLVDPPDDGPGKPVNIELHIGRPPILAGGNANGDIEMLEFAEAGGNPCLNLLVHHNDAEREYAYDHGAEKALALAAQRGWTIVSMKEDFKTVF